MIYLVLKDNSVALERVCPYKPLSGVQPFTRRLDYNSLWKPALVKLPYGTKEITFKAERKVKIAFACCLRNSFTESRISAFFNLEVI